MKTPITEVIAKKLHKLCGEASTKAGSPWAVPEWSALQKWHTKAWIVLARHVLRKGYKP